MRALIYLLLFEIAGRVDPQGGHVAHSGQTESLRAQLAAPRSRRAGSIVLDRRIDGKGPPQDGHFTDKLSRAGARRLQCQLDVVARQVSRQKQIALRLVPVEDLLICQMPQILLEFAFCPPGFAAGADGCDTRVQNLENYNAVLDTLGGHLNRRQIALVTQDRGGRIADLA